MSRRTDYDPTAPRLDRQTPPKLEFAVVTLDELLDRLRLAKNVLGGKAEVLIADDNDLMVYRPMLKVQGEKAPVRFGRLGIQLGKAGGMGVETRNGHRVWEVRHLSVTERERKVVLVG